ncbi:hypothetical protein WMY93_003153 [Mugilogobius chulae]|uniref:Uncharacterized protein n=1 Tax=Mugilogobius chulae TaxID=88201 RepID=A0AAW0PZ43_9GOBI
MPAVVIEPCYLLVLKAAVTCRRERENLQTQSREDHLRRLWDWTLMPLFDDDTGLLILAGMGDSVIDCFEISTSDPELTQVSHCLTDASTRGVCTVPKLEMDVMSCEVMRVLQLTDNHIVPVSYQVPRKNSGNEFHEDLFPVTVGTIAAMSADEWWQGGNKQPERCNPSEDEAVKALSPESFSSQFPLTVRLSGLESAGCPVSGLDALEVTPPDLTETGPEATDHPGRHRSKAPVLL